MEVVLGAPGSSPRAGRLPVASSAAHTARSRTYRHGCWLASREGARLRHANSFSRFGLMSSPLKNAPPPLKRVGGTLKAGCSAILAFMFAVGALGPRIPATWSLTVAGVANVAVLIAGVGAGVAVYRMVKHVVRTKAERLHRDTEARRVEQERLERERREAREAELRRVAEAIDEHASVLRTKRAQLRHPDEYGIIDEEPWLEHCDYFVGHVIKRQFPDLEEFIVEQLPQLIDVVLDQPATGASTLQRADVHGMDGIAYEHHCAEILTAHGWATTVTKASGDQGVDVIARRGDMKLVLQCKRYSAPVGNKAVQEVIAARQFEDATHAAVVSTAPYTDSARALAHKTGVYLISQEQLPQLWGILTDSR